MSFLGKTMYTIRRYYKDKVYEYSSDKYPYWKTCRTNVRWDELNRLKFKLMYTNPYLKTADIMAEFGIARATVYYTARHLGLPKPKRISRNDGSLYYSEIRSAALAEIHNITDKQKANETSISPMVRT